MPQSIRANSLIQRSKMVGVHIVLKQKKQTGQIRWINPLTWHIKLPVVLRLLLADLKLIHVPA